MIPKNYDLFRFTQGDLAGLLCCVTDCSENKDGSVQIHYSVVGDGAKLEHDKVYSFYTFDTDPIMQTVQLLKMASCEEHESLN